MHGRDLLILKAQLNIEPNAELIRALGIDHKTFYATLLKDEVPHPLALACAALAAGLAPYSPPIVTPEMQLRIEACSASTLRWLEQRLVSPNLHLLEAAESETTS